MRRVVHDGEGHVIASMDDDQRSRWRGGDGSVADWRSAAAIAADLDDDGVSTVRFQELYSRTSRHLVRVTALRVDALGNHSSPFGKVSSSTCPRGSHSFSDYSRRRQSNQNRIESKLV